MNELFKLRCFALVVSAFPMRFPRDEWNTALKYYRPTLKLTTNHDLIIDKTHNDEEKENESHIIIKE
jgi:hypothetical protein